MEIVVSHYVIELAHLLDQGTTCVTRGPRQVPDMDQVPNVPYRRCVEQRRCVGTRLSQHEWRWLDDAIGVLEGKGRGHRGSRGPSRWGWRGGSRGRAPCGGRDRDDDDDDEDNGGDNPRDDDVNGGRDGVDRGGHNDGDDVGVGDGGGVGGGGYDGGVVGGMSSGGFRGGGRGVDDRYDGGMGRCLGGGVGGSGGAGDVGRDCYGLGAQADLGSSDYFVGVPSSDETV
ncbi:uncharacterized protein LOC107464894 [Arachis duranensis]|uniref:Uncharacterized protein LOC107464894 n=1 Tax=Arachis duranensis TaxID=130453 RepID=A0A6P4BGA7_ARADU|nr:uncharacterized protein LOC107464894 [Arachis duranensis]